MSTSTRWTILGLVLLGFIIIPFLLFGARVDAWSVEMLQQLQGQRVPLAVLIVALLTADVVAPVPSSIVAAASGAALGVGLGLSVTAAGLTIGCVVGYAIGRFGRTRLIERIVGPNECSRLSSLTNRYGNWTVVVARPLPVVAEASTILAGAADMPFGRFMLLTTSANLVIATAYAILGSGLIQALAQVMTT
jgi:membrane protein DedA with SNARE-associated domain